MEANRLLRNGDAALRGTRVREIEERFHAVSKRVRVLARARSDVVDGGESVEGGARIVDGGGDIESVGTRQGVLTDPRAPGHEAGIAAVLREAQEKFGYLME